MSDIRITNCHVHLFTTAHTPRYFPNRFVVVFRYFPGLVRFARWVAELLPYESFAASMLRLEAFHRAGQRTSQAEVFRHLRRFYPADTRFVVLPLDMDLIGHGPVEKPIRDQHEELAKLTAKHPDNIIPFACVYPDREAPHTAMEELRHCVEELGFRGVKLYPPTGFAPDHPVLMDQIYPYCVENNLPVMVHCSRGGVYLKGWDGAQRDAVCEPYAFRRVLSSFPDLRLCLAHYGGKEDWASYIDDGFDPDLAHSKARNWVYQINKMLTSGAYPNLWVDISYTMFRFESFQPLLKLFLRDESIRTRVLFGSDFYMTLQEEHSEKAVSLALRDALGEEIFGDIAQHNPEIWLGERT
ncbi:amidohydrolase family protein [Celeribacter arenosi]|uniref:Amidohydrolase family protein n=1 Tax=Celeribacter arenosi TaxID=792649 RepID=A0ABP7K6X2_9RHOB